MKNSIYCVFTLKLARGILDGYDDGLLVLFIHPVNNSIVTNKKLSVFPVSIRICFPLWKAVGHFFKERTSFSIFSTSAIAVSGTSKVWAI